MAYLKSILLMLSITFSCLNYTIASETKSSQIEIIDGKSYFIHTVEKGQTLYALSKLYSVSIQEITQANEIKGNSLKQGSTIRIPQVSGQPSTQKVSFGGKDYYLHKIKKGETLFSIGKNYNISPAVIMSANPEASSNIAEGQVLKIPAEGEFVSSPSKNNSIAQNYPQITTHTVTKGESLYGIAKKYNTSVSAILGKNPSCRNGLKTGQDISIPLPPKKRAFFFHQIEKGDTYYSLSKYYGVSTDALQKDNATAKSNLKEGTFLKIEKTEDNARLAKTYPGFSFHEIEKGETFFNISKQYGIAEKKLKKLNPGIDISALQTGAILKVPGKQVIEEKDSLNIVSPEAETSPVVFSCDSIHTDSIRPINIAMLLPLFLTANDTISLSENIIRRQEKVFPKSIPFVEFYEGALLALDTLKAQGYTVNLSIFDTNKDSLATKQAMLDMDLEHTDLIIGPVYSNTFEVASEIAKGYNIPIVSPLSSSTHGVIDNPFSIIANTPQHYRIETTSLFVSQKNDYNFVMIHNGGVQDFAIMDIYKKVLFSSFADSAIFADVVFKELNFSDQGIEGVQDALSISSRNIVIIPSQNQGFVNNIVTQLYQFHKKYDIDLMGLSVWEQYDNIELDYLFGLNYHFGTNYYIDYSQPVVKEFIEKYRKTFKTEPTKYSFHGYDVFYYFTKAVNKYPFFVCECISDYHALGLQSNFDFEPFSEGKGLVNTNVTLVRYSDDYKPERVEFDAQVARKAFWEKEKKKKEEKTETFEELFTE